MKRFIQAFMIIAAIFGLLALSSCDTNGAAAAPTARSANDALRAIPLVSEVLDMGGNGAQSLSAAGWIGALDNGGEENNGDECEKHQDLCFVESEVQQFLNNDHLLLIIREMARVFPLQMNTVNVLGTRSTDFLPPEPGCELSDEGCPEEMVVDFGVIQVTESANSVNIQWVIPGPASEDEDSLAGATYFLEFVLHGWPNAVSRAEFWMIHEDEDDDDNPGFSYGYGDLLIGERAALVWRENFSDSRIEQMVFRAFGVGGLDGILLMDSEDNGDSNFVQSYRTVPDTHTVTARTPLEGISSNSELRLFVSPNDSAPAIEETTSSGDGGQPVSRTVHDREDLAFRRTLGPDVIDIADQDNIWLKEFLERSAELYDELTNDFEMPTKPNVTTHFPALP